MYSFPPLLLLHIKHTKGKFITNKLSIRSSLHKHIIIMEKHEFHTLAKAIMSKEI